jgi:Flp pilus assembly protein TadG
MPARLRHLLKDFKTADSGALALVAALAAIPLFGAAGFAVDYAVQNARQADFQAATDAAVLAGVKATTEQLTSGTGNGRAKKPAKRLPQSILTHRPAIFPAPVATLRLPSKSLAPRSRARASTPAR